jgi:hypothetical protein
MYTVCWVVSIGVAVISISSTETKDFVRGLS